MTESIVKIEQKFNKPSPASYNDPWKKQAGIQRTIGNYKQKEIAINFVQEAENDSLLVPPMNKYDKINMDITHERIKQPKIYKTSFPRFKPLEKDGKPAPTSYNNYDTINQCSTYMNSSKYSVGKDKKVFIQDLRVKQIYSTSPASYRIDGSSYDAVARNSPRSKTKRQ